jgi:hypothetical protein
VAGVDPAAAGVRGVGELAAAEEAGGPPRHRPPHRPPERGGPGAAYRDHM